MSNTFHTFSKELAKDFLQTVIVVDDRAFFPSNDVTKISEPIIRPGFGGDNEEPSETEGIQDDETETNSQKHEDLNAKELIDEFARNSIV
jgi:hypothetical protein